MRNLILSLVLLLSLSARAATITWTNAASGNWNIPANWNPNQVPGASDTAVITNVSVTVTLNISPTVGGIILGADAGCGGGTTLLMNGQTLTLNGPMVVGSCGHFTLNSGTLTGTNNATLSGVINWPGGNGYYAHLAGTLTLATNGTLNIISVSGADYHDLPGGTFTNNGTVMWTGGQVRGGLGTLIQNKGLWIAQVTNEINGVYGGAIAFNNSGTFAVQSGTVTMNVSGTNTGGFDVAAGATCNFSFPYIFNSGTVFTGAGTNRFNNAVTYRLDGLITSQNLEFAAGTLLGTNNATLSGVIGWGGGSSAALTLVGTLTIPSNGTLNISGNTYHDLPGCTLINNGTVVWTGGQVRGGLGTLIQNNGLWIARVTNEINSVLGPTPAFNNSGTFDVQSGTVDFSMAGTSTGTFHVAAGAACNFKSSYRFDNGTVFTGAGTNRLNNAATYRLGGLIACQNLEFAAGTLLGTNNATLSGVIGWGGGSSATLAGTLALATNGTLNITGNTFHDLAGVTLINHGTVLWTGGQVRGGTDTVIQNNGLWIAQVTSEINGVLGPTPAFNNSGTFDVQSGTVDFSMAGTSTGTFHVAASATCNFKSSYRFDNGTAFSGAGTNRFNGGAAAAIYMLDGSIYAQNVEFTAGHLAGNHILSGSNGFAGSFTWFGGSMDSPGATTIASNAALSIMSGSLHDLPSRTLINNGTVVFAGGDVRGGLGNFIQNSGLWLVQTDKPISADYGGAMAFNNTGIFRKTAGVGTATVSCDFTNSGTVSAQSGTLSFSGSFTNPAGILSVAGGSKIQFAEPLDLPAGLVTGSGIVQSPSVTSSAVVSPGAPNAVLTIAGNYRQQLGGSMEFDIGGTTPGTDQSQVIVTGAAKLDGAVSVRFGAGYSPAVSSSNRVLTAASLSGAFKCFSGFYLLGENKRLTTLYAPTSLSLISAAAPDPAGVSLTVAIDKQVLVCWPAEFGSNQLYFSTNLNQTDWTLISGPTNRYLETPSVPEKYFRLRQSP